MPIGHITLWHWQIVCLSVCLLDKLFLRLYLTKFTSYHFETWYNVYIDLELWSWILWSMSRKKSNYCATDISKSTGVIDFKLTREHASLENMPLAVEQLSTWNLVPTINLSPTRWWLDLGWIFWIHHNNFMLLRWGYGCIISTLECPFGLWIPVQAFMNFYSPIKCNCVLRG